MAKKKDNKPGVELASSLDKLLASKAMASIHKDHGDAIFMKASEHDSAIPRIPTGVFRMDYATGGGLPVGRVTVIWGHKSSAKTTTYLKTIANAQKMCASCWQFQETCNCGNYRDPVIAFLDVEGTLDLRWAKVLGVDLDRMLYSKPEYAEQTLDIAEAIIRNGADIMVIDSLAFLAPAAEIMKSTSEDTVGLQARQLGKGTRKFVAAVNTVSNARGIGPTLFFTNQVRMKVGVMFGCFPYQAPVLLADGTKRSIGQIVNQKQPVEVLSWNAHEKRFEPKRVVRWWKQGVDVDECCLSDNDIGALRQEYRTLVVSYPDGSGHTKITATPNHEISTPRGFVSADTLDLDDEVYCRHERVVFSHDLEQLIFGSLLGDGSIRKSGRHTSYFRESHAQKERQYLMWKRECFGDLVRESLTDRDDERSEVGFETRALSSFSQYKRLFYGESGRYKRIPRSWPMVLSPFALAIWYQDDGWLADEGGTRKRNVICLHETTPDEKDHIKKLIEGLFGLQVAVCSGGHRTDIQFNGEVADKFEKIVAGWVHPSMSHKLRTTAGVGQLLPRLEFGWCTEVVAHPCPVVEIRRSMREGSSGVRYNLEVEDNATYVVGDAIVHNSPETQPGGLSTGFASSLEIKTRAGKFEMDEVLGKPLTAGFAFRVEKNKAGVPKMEGDFKLLLMSTEHRRVGDAVNEPFMVDMAQKVGLVEGGGSSWKALGEKFKSKTAIEEAMIQSPDFYLRMHSALMAVLLSDD